MIAATVGQVNPWIILFGSMITLAAPLILAAMGGYMSERSGVMNIALEGKMLIATITTALAADRFNNAYIGVLCGIAAAVALSLLHWLLTQEYRFDHIVSGMAINALAIGGASYLDRRFTNLADRAGIPFLNTWVFYVLAIALPLLIALWAKRTRGGLRLQATGSDPDKTRLMGVEPQRVRLWSLVATGVLCGLSGALIVSNASTYTDNMTAGRGFIALAALIIGGWRPIPAMIACLIFGILEGSQIQWQGTRIFGGEVPREIWLTLPYVVTILALAGFLGKSRAPAGLGKP